MNDEIKYWLEGLDDLSYKKVLDYITNLQQEYYNEAEENFKLSECLVKKQQRIDKAIEYIEEMLYPIGTCVNGSDLPYDSIESLLNILQNGSDDNE